MTTNTDFLAENGPSTREELPTSTQTRDKMDGLRSFGSSNLSNVYYLRKHDPLDVIIKYCLENPELIDEYTEQEYHQHLSKMERSWKPQIREAKDILKGFSGVMYEDYKRVAIDGISYDERADERDVDVGVISANVYEMRHRYEENKRKGEGGTCGEFSHSVSRIDS